MKNIFTKALAAMAVAILFASCNADDENTAPTGNLTIEYDNSFAGNDLILTTQPNTTSSNEVLKVSSIKYIISNIELTDKNGNVFIYPKSQSYFIVDESKPETLLLQLKNIPVSEYTKVKFGIGVDQAQWELGAEGQANFVEQAEAADMMWTWTAGYKFLAFEGTFTSPTIADPATFMVHTGKTGTDYNYTAVTLDLPTPALVRGNITPEIHVVADLSKIIDGTNKIKLSDAAMVMGGAKLAQITANLSEMFTVAHVHND